MHRFFWRTYLVVSRRPTLQPCYRLLRPDMTFPQPRSQPQAPQMGTPPHGVRHNTTVAGWGTVIGWDREPRTRHPLTHSPSNIRSLVPMTHFQTNLRHTNLVTMQNPANRLKSTLHLHICHLTSVDAIMQPKHVALPR